MSFLEARVSFPSKFASLFSVRTQNRSVLFHLNLYMLWTKGAHQSANLTSTGRIKINQIPFVIFKALSQFSFKFSSPYSAMIHNFSEIFYLKQYMLWTKKRRNFSLLTRYSLKFTHCSSLVVKSLATRCKIRSLLVAIFARYSL